MHSNSISTSFLSIKKCILVSPYHKKSFPIPLSCLSFGLFLSCHFYFSIPSNQFPPRVTVPLIHSFQALFILFKLIPNGVSSKEPPFCISPQPLSHPVTCPYISPFFSVVAFFPQYASVSPLSSFPCFLFFLVSASLCLCVFLFSYSFALNSFPLHYLLLSFSSSSFYYLPGLFHDTDLFLFWF